MAAAALGLQEAASRTARRAVARIRTEGGARRGAAVNGTETSAERERVDTVTGLMSATAIFLAVLGATDLHLTISGEDIQMRPIRVGVAAVLLALIAAGIGGRHRKLAAIACMIAAGGWLVGMIVAVITERPLF